jgi:hypothetical protein
MNARQREQWATILERQWSVLTGLVEASYGIAVEGVDNERILRDLRSHLSRSERAMRDACTALDAIEA